MDNWPIEPRLIIFIVVALIGFLQNVLKKKPSQHETYDVPEPDYDPLGEFRDLIEEARQKAESPEPAPAPVVIVSPPEPIHTAPEITKTAETEPSPTLNVSSKPKPEQQSRQPRQQKGSIQKLLTSPGAARQAIILTEVLGKPKSLQ